MRNKRISNITISAMLLAVGYVLPFVTGQIPEFGKMLLPMHIPIFLCGLICGSRYGLITGLILPITRSIIFGTPLMYPNGISMMFELGAYGFIAGIMYEKSNWKCIRALYRSLLGAMLGGRIVWGVVMVLLLGIGDGGFTVKAFLTGALLQAIPGIALQIILIPAIMAALGKTKIDMRHKNKSKKERMVEV